MTDAPDVVDPLALENQVCFALAVAARSVIALYRPLLDPMGLTHPQYLVMLALWGSSPLSVKEIGGLLQLDSATLSPLLKRLQGLRLRPSDAFGRGRAPRPRRPDARRSGAADVGAHDPSVDRRSTADGDPRT